MLRLLIDKPSSASVGRVAARGPALGNVTFES